MLNEKHDSNGHRQRLRKKFSAINVDLFEDYELLEMLLFSSKPRGDVKPLAKTLIKEFGGLAKVIYGEAEKLATITDVGPSTIHTLKLIQVVIARILKKQIEKKVILQSWSSLIDYLMVTQGYKTTEQFRVLYLNTKNILIADERQEYGTIDQTQIYPRELLKRCIFHSAGALILVHNHPSGNVKPSQADIEMTKKLIDACATINVTIHDHVIVSNNDFYSFKSNMLI